MAATTELSIVPMHLRRNAIHEAGHAVAHLLMGHPIAFVTIDPKQCTVAGGLGQVQVHLPHPGDDYLLAVEGFTLQQLAVGFLAGGYAVARANLPAEGHLADVEGALRFARASVGNLIPTAGDNEVDAYLNFARFCARELVARHWQAIEIVAAALLERITLTGDELVEILGGTQ